MAKSVWGSLSSKKKVSREEYLKMVRRVRYFITLGFGMSLAVFVAIALFGGIYRVFDIFITSKLYIYAIAFVAVFAGYMVRFQKWNYLLKKLGIHVRLKENMITYLSLYSMNITPGRIGRVISAYTVSRITGVKTSKIVPAVMMDIFTDFVGFAIFALIFGVLFHRFIVYILTADIVLLLPFLFITHDWFYKRIKKFLKRFKKNGYFGLFSVYGDEYFSAQSSLNTLRTYIVSLAITLPADFLSACALFITLYSLGVTAPFSGTMFVYASSYLFGMVSGLPGGIGVNDASLVAMIGGVFGLNSIVSSAATIMTRVATLWFGVAVGTVFLIYSMRYWEKKRIRKRSKKR
jgi:uncharacterized protein (TIRG00374 family)